MLDTVGRTLRRYEMLQPGDGVVCAVSGGADSMALLWAMYLLREKLSICLSAAHFNHNLRGAESQRDEAFVRTFCGRYEIPLTVGRAPVEPGPKGLEAAARDARYAFLETLPGKLATAHTADDNAETVLMHILRGSGVGGLCSIPAKRGRIVRPLLECTRAEIEDYCAENGVPYIVDSTNTDMTYTRNRVRHQLLPLLREMNPSVTTALRRLRSSAVQDEEFFSALAEQALADAYLSDGSFDRERFLLQSPSVRVRMWKRLLSQQGCESYTEQHIDALEAALAANRGTVYLANGCSACFSADRVRFFSHRDTVVTLCIPVTSLPLRFVFDGREHVLQPMSREELTSLQNVHKKFLQYTLDCDRIQGSLSVRCRREGDYFHPAGRQVGKTLKSLFQELRVPTYYRETLPLLCDDEGIVLMPGVACDSRVCPDDSTKHFLVWLIDGEPSYTLSYLMDSRSDDRDTTEPKE